MPFTRDQMGEIKLGIKAVLDDILENDNFIQKIIEKVSIAFELKLEAKLKEKEELHQREIRELEEKIDILEQHWRRQNVGIYGVKEVHGGSPLEDFNNTMSKLSIQPKSPAECYRIGHFKPGGKPRPIFVKLSNYEEKVEIMKNRRKLKGIKIHIKEDLTKTRIEIMKRASEKYGFKNVWSLNGRIFALVNGIKTEFKTMNILSD